MDIQTGAALFSLLDQSLGLLKKARDVMPESKEKKDLTKQLAEVEAAYRVAEARAAQELGYELCKCSWPPQIMLLASDGRAECSKCRRRAGASTGDGGGDTAAQSENELASEEIKVLEFLGKADSSREVTDVAGSLGMPEQRAKYWLTKLVERDMVSKSQVPMVGVMYSLKQKGRECLIARGLL